MIKRKTEKLLAECARREKTVNSELKELSDGRLMYATINCKPGYFCVTYENGKRKRRVITKNGEFIRALIRKERLMMEKQTLESNRRLLENALNKMESDDYAKYMRTLLNRYPAMDATMLEAALLPQPSGWANEPYEQSDRYLEYRTQRTSRGLLVRSKSELNIAEALYEAGLEFRYEQLLHIGDVCYTPDFTIRRRDGKIVYWEHQGLMANSRYFDAHFNKLRNYYANGIVPWDNLILTYDSLDGELDMREIRLQIDTKLRV